MDNAVLCFVCNAITGPHQNDVEAFDASSQMPSGKCISDIIGELIYKSINICDFTNTKLCSKCLKLCTEYDQIQTRMGKIKEEFLVQYNNTNKKNKLDVPKAVKEKISPKPLVLPASKLKPLQPYMILKNNTLRNISVAQSRVESKFITAQSKVVKISSGTPFLTQNVISPSKTRIIKPATKITINSPLLSTPKKKDSNSIEEVMITESIDLRDHSNNVITTASSMPLLTTSLSDSMINFNMKNVPKNFLGGNNESRNENDSDGNDDLANNDDEQPMEIDEECSLSKPSTTQTSDFNKVFAEIKKIKPDESVFDISLLSNLEQEVESQEDDIVVSKVEILDVDDADSDGNTILMEGEDGSFIRVMAGQKFMYGDSEISLIIPQDDNDNDANDNQDSNDESQLEFQVSGDEDTANAIIAAAKEQGGAFIKVQSGEMYRVKSVKSQVEAVADPLGSYSVIESMVQIVGSTYRCLLCVNTENNSNAITNKAKKNFSTKDPGAISQHLKLVHSARIYVCEDCGELFHTRVELRSHMASNHEKSLSPNKKKSQYECGVCKKQCGSRNLLAEHMNQHEGVRPYSCDKCEKTFASKYTHQAHLKTHTDRPRPFKCKQCGKSFFTQQNLSQHEKIHNGVKNFICKECGKAFGSQHNLEVHGVVHSGLKPFRCETCGKGFARKAEIRDHIRTHTGERPYACSICGATFSQRSNLHSHIRATHTDDKRYACQHCDKRFKRRRLLEYHIKASHTGERPYQCEICKTTFVYPEHYKKHARIHSGEKPYECEMCGKTFNSRDNRNAHRFVHSDKKPYECLVCGAGFMRKPQLYAHMNTCGHMTESIVVNQPRLTNEPDNKIYQVVEAAQFENKTAASDDSAKLYSLSDGTERKIHSDDNLSGADKFDTSILATLANEELEKGTQIMASDENGGVVRLVQIELPNGGNGWIAID